MKDLLKCSLDELLSEKQKAIEANDIERYRECNELISTMYAKWFEKTIVPDNSNSNTNEVLCAEDLFGY